MARMVHSDMVHDAGNAKPFFQLLGGFHPHEGLNSRQQALLAYLALRHPAPVSRAELAFKLWADSNEEQALTNLRKTLYHIKQNFPDGEIVQADARTLQLTPGVQLDLADFTAALDSAERARRARDAEAEQTALETAAAFYRGDLLPHLYDEWLIPERDRLRDMFIRAMDRLIALLEARKHYRDAIKHAQRLLQTDNLREETYRTLIRLHALNDDRAAALNVYHTCASVLSAELGVEPNSSTRDIYERLLKNESQLLRVNIPARPISTPLVAREPEWKQLIAEWKKTAKGELRTVLLSGEAGIGKTRLAEDFLHWASQQGIRTASARCYSAEGQLSFAPIAGWVRSMPLPGLDAHWQNELARILPELRSQYVAPHPMTENWQRQAFFESMARALLSEDEPLVLLLDDIQWCDHDTLDWLRYFLRFDKVAKILVLVTLRAEELPSNNTLQMLLVDLRAEGQLTEVELSRLDEKQTAELGTHLLGKNFAAADTAALFRESEGVPLFVVELANAGVRVGSAWSVEPGAVDAARGAGLPPRLRAVLEGRLARLSSPARTVIESAAVIGREFDIDLLRQISEIDEGSTINALDELWRVRMVRERSGRYDFSHDKLREATLLGISPIRLRWLHQRVGEALETELATVEYPRIADHFERAGLPVKASDYHARAAEQAQQLYAFTEALEHLRRAILLETRPERLASLHEHRGDVLQLLGLREDSFQAFAQAFGLAGAPLQKARLARKQMVLISRYDTVTTHEKYEKALEELSLVQHEPDYWPEWIEIQFACIQARYWQQDADGMDALLAQTQAPVERYGTPAQKINQYHRVINSMLMRERGRLHDQHLELARENVARAVATADSRLISTTCRTFSMVAFFAERFEESVAAFREAIDLSEKNGDGSSLLIARVYISLAHRRLKNIEAVRADTQVLMTLLQKLSKNPEYEGVSEGNLAWLAYRAGNRRAARQHAQSAHEIWKSLTTKYPVQWGALIILFALAVEENNVEASSQYAGDLLAPALQRLNPLMESALLAALEVDLVDRELALRRFKNALEAAKETGYL